jgi:hypothetical protein
MPRANHRIGLRAGFAKPELSGPGAAILKSLR